MSVRSLFLLRPIQGFFPRLNLVLPDFVGLDGAVLPIVLVRGGVNVGIINQLFLTETTTVAIRSSMTLAAMSKQMNLLTTPRCYLLINIFASHMRRSLLA